MSSCAAVEAAPPPDETRRLRDALGRFATGVAVVTTTTGDGKREGVTVNSFSALSLNPPLVLWSLRRAAPSFESFATCEHFAVSVLSADQVQLSRHFGQPSADKFAGVASRSGHGDCPVLEASIAVFECAVHQRIEAGDHLLFIGSVENYHLSDGTPLIFSGGRYCAPIALDAATRTPAVGSC